MSIIVAVRVPSSAFALGRALKAQVGTRIELETVVPLGTGAVPRFWAYHVDDAFVPSASDHPAVRNLTATETFEDRTLFALDWNADADDFLRAVADADGQVLDATGVREEWRLELRFPDHDAVSAFRSACREEGVPLDVERVSAPEAPDAAASFGLTPVQRETLVLAVEAGYYDIPRRCTTVELAERLGVSDQAVTERLRRAIVSVVSNAVVATGGDA